MSETTLACILKYLVKGVAPDRDSQHRLEAELTELLPQAAGITILPVVDGFSVEIEMSDLAPFSRASFEPYVAEHVLPEAVAIRCNVLDEVSLQLLKAHYA